MKTVDQKKAERTDAVVPIKATPEPEPQSEQPENATLSTISRGVEQTKKGIVAAARKVKDVGTHPKATADQAVTWMKENPKQTAGIAAAAVAAVGVGATAAVLIKRNRNAKKAKDTPTEEV